MTHPSTPHPPMASPPRTGVSIWQRSKEAVTQVLRLPGRCQPAMNTVEFTNLAEPNASRQFSGPQQTMLASDIRTGSVAERRKIGMNNRIRSLSNWPRTWITVASLGLIGVVGIIDRATGFEVSVSLFYLLPVALSTWYAGRATGMFIALVSTAVWLVADIVDRPAITHPLLPAWNTVIMGSWFVLVTMLLAALKRTTANLEHTVLQRTDKLRSEIAERRRAEDQLTRSNAELMATHGQLHRSLADLRHSYAELQKTQLQLIEAAKMESIGRLAAGVAHEVKNPLMTLSLGADYFSQRAPASADEAALLQDMKDAVQRASGIINLLLDYSKPQPLQRSSEDINSIIENSLALMRHQLIKQNVTVIRQLQPDLQPLSLDKNRMQHALLNLFTNAMHAMPGGGTLTVRTYTDTGSPSEDGSSVQVIVEVEDTGPGIPQEHLARVFEPFYTTKPPGQGTGLGLSIVQKIVRIHGGTISIGN